MPTLRRATVDDAPLIAAHRHAMFADNHFATDAHLSTMDAAFEPWVRAHLAGDTYIGLFLEDESTHAVLAAGGILLHDFPPHWMDIQHAAPTCSTSTPLPKPAVAATPNKSSAPASTCAATSA